MKGIYKAFGGKNGKWVRMGHGGIYLRSDKLSVQKSDCGKLWGVYYNGHFRGKASTLKEAKSLAEAYLTGIESGLVAA